MQKKALIQKTEHRFLQKQIPFLKLLQLPSDQLPQHIEEELEKNPALEIEDEAPLDQASLDTLNNLSRDHPAPYHHPARASDAQAPEISIPVKTSLHEQLIEQLGFLRLNPMHYTIGKQIIGSIENDGYLRRPLQAIADDLALTQDIDTTEEEILRILQQIQSFDPPGIAARDLRECLLLQFKHPQYLQHKNKAYALAHTIVEQCFDLLSKKNYQKMKETLRIRHDKTLRQALLIITKLNPKPGNMESNPDPYPAILSPDFIITEQRGQPIVSLNNPKTPRIRLSKSYTQLITAYKKTLKKNERTTKALAFVKQKIEAAGWFLDALQQRENTLLNTATAVVQRQKQFFINGDLQLLQPMGLKDIAKDTSVSTSTISRIVNNKHIQTKFGIFPLKRFFSQAIHTPKKTISNAAIKEVIRDLIRTENKQQPLSDIRIEQLLKEKNYPVARRTIAKYREQLHIPSAKLRKRI